MIYEMQDQNVDNVCCWLSSELRLSRSVNQAVRETAADPSEVLLALLYEAKRLAREHGISGDDLLVSAMTDRNTRTRREVAPNGVHEQFREIVREVRERQIANLPSTRLAASYADQPVRSRQAKSTLIDRVRGK